MNRLAAIFKKDVILGVKDVFLLLEVSFAIIFVLVLLFIVPEDVRTTGMAYIYDTTHVVEDFVTEYVPDIEDSEGEYYVESREALIEGMVEDVNSIGLIITNGVEDTYGVELLTQPYTKEGVIDFVEVDLEDLLSIIAPPYGIYPEDVYASVRLEARQRGTDEIIPFNKSILPTFLIFNVGLIGLFALVSIIGQERVDMTIRAFRLTPTSLNYFLASKYLLMLCLGLVTFTIIYIPMMGFSGYLLSLLIMMITVLVMSSIGIILASFYKGPMEAMGWVFIIMTLLTLPVVSQLNPVFSPAWLKLFPTYYTIFALDAAMFPSDNGMVIWQGIAVLAPLMVILILFSGWIFNRKIRKEA